MSVLHLFGNTELWDGPVPLTPSEWQHHRDAVDGPSLKAVINEVNAILRESKTTPIYIDAKVLGFDSVRQRAIKLYQLQGWKVTYHDDQIEGDFYEFTPSVDPHIIAGNYASS